jgi:stress-induced morphogen
MIAADEIRDLIRRRMPDAVVRLKDLTGGGDHWDAVVVSQAFEGKSPVEQHQLVYAALGEAMRERIHALQLKTYTPNSARSAGLLTE